MLSQYEFIYENNEKVYIKINDCVLEIDLIEAINNNKIKPIEEIITIH